MLKRLTAGLSALVVALFASFPAFATTSSISSFISDIDFSGIVETLGSIGGSIIAVYAAIKLIRWILMSFM